MKRKNPRVITRLMSTKEMDKLLFPETAKLLGGVMYVEDDVNMTDKELEHLKQLFKASIRKAN